MTVTREQIIHILRDTVDQTYGVGADAILALFAEQAAKLNEGEIAAQAILGENARLTARVVELEVDNARLREAMTWKPMDTAPKNEKILTLMKYGAIEGRWDGTTASKYYWRDMDWYPSKWMHLPPEALGEKS